LIVQSLAHLPYYICHLYLSLTLIVNHFEYDLDVNGVESNIKFPPPLFSELTSRIEVISNHTGAGETELLSTSFSRVTINHKSRGTKSSKGRQPPTSERLIDESYNSVLYWIVTPENNISFSGCQWGFNSYL
jgi:hypothetical protein